MDIKDASLIAGGIVSVVAVLLSGWLGIFVFRQFAPVLTLRVVPTWLGDDSSCVLLRLEVENKSRVRVHKRIIRLQVLEHEVREGGSLSEWVPFEEKRVRPLEKPDQWKDPVEVFETTSGIDPGEILVADRLHDCPAARFLHVGLQAEAKLGVFGKIAARVRGNNQSWTTTCIIARPGAGDQNSVKATVRHA